MITNCSTLKKLFKFKYKITSGLKGLYKLGMIIDLTSCLHCWFLNFNILLKWEWGHIYNVKLLIWQKHTISKKPKSVPVVVQTSLMLCYRQLAWEEARCRNWRPGCLGVLSKVGALFLFLCRMVYHCWCWVSPFPLSPTEDWGVHSLAYPFQKILVYKMFKWKCWTGKSKVYLNGTYVLLNQLHVI